jgi:glycosyltransferase involved in cell wall biosynthesis
VVVDHEKNRGVGSSFHTGTRKALTLDPDIMVNIDADGQFNPEDITKLIEPIVSREAEFVTASRFKDPEYYPKMSKAKFIGNKFMSHFIGKIGGQKFYDVSCGFRAYSKDALLHLNLFGEFTYTQETFLNLLVKNVPILEVPIKVRGIREHGKSKVASNLLTYGYNTLKVILKSMRDYWPLKLFSIISMISFIVGFGLGTFLLIHYIISGGFTPHKWAGFTAGFFLILALGTLTIGFILDMFARMRINQEEMLYYMKCIFFKNKNDD